MQYSVSVPFTPARRLGPRQPITYSLRPTIIGEVHPYPTLRVQSFFGGQLAGQPDFSLVTPLLVSPSQQGQSAAPANDPHETTRIAEMRISDLLIASILRVTSRGAR